MNSDSRLETIRCLDWNDFLEKTRYFDNYSGGGQPAVLFRGQSNADWLVESTLARAAKDRQDYANMEKFSQPDKFLERFKEGVVDCISPISLDNLTENQIWSLGRHYGLITPLIDWTESIYIATYFAASDFWERHCAATGVYDFNLHKCRPIAIYAYQPGANHDLYGLSLFQGASQNLRRRRQQMGWFTVQKTDPYLDFLTWISTKERMEWPLKLTKFLIPSHVVESILADLYRMNIRSLNLFDGIEGAVKYANWEYKRFAPSSTWNDDPKLLEEIEGEWGSDFIKRWSSDKKL